MRRFIVPVAVLALAIITSAALYAVWDGNGDDGDDGDDGRGVHYLALGDSLAVGVQPGGMDPRSGYVARIHRALRVDEPSLRLTNLACSGETTESLVDGERCSYGDARSQLDAATSFLRRNRGATRVVTIDIGANDVTGCVTSDGIDTSCVASSFAAVRANLDRILRELRAAGGDDVMIVGMTYYDPFLAAWLEGPRGRRVARASVRFAEQFNQQLKATYEAHGADVADVADAFATSDMGGGARPVNVTRVCRWTWMCTAHRDIHANDAGYAVIARTFLGVIRDTAMARQ